QPWAQVRFWLHDLATEISAAEKDGSLPALALDRVWITADGRAKLLDFPAPGAGRGGPPGPPDSAPGLLAPAFLERVARAALGAVPQPLPLHAQNFLGQLPALPGPEAIASAL